MKRSLYLALAAAVLAIGLIVNLRTAVEPAPASIFVLLDGSRKTADDFKGRVTLINFWATSCVTCVAEMPKLTAAYDKFHGRGFDVMAVAMKYTQTRKLPFNVAIDNTGSVAKAWGDVQLTPTSFVVNRRGEIVKRYVGEPDFTELHRLIETLLAHS
jgi:thiol-disulfide isomerase/thioredoxin